MGDENTASNPAALDRRAFISKNLAAGLAAATLLTGETRTMASESQAASRAAKTQHSALPVRDFGKAGRQLPILACGGSAMVEKWQRAYGPQLSFKGRLAMIRHAFESGIRYFDTSPNYGESESLLGEALHDVRDQVYLATKVGVPRSDDAILEPGQVRASLEKSLEVLRTDHVDCVQIHGSVFEYVDVPRANAIYDELVKLREEKLFRYIGLTGHNTFELMYRLVDSGRFDQLLIAYGYFPKGYKSLLSLANLAWRERCLNRAHELGMGVVAMKVFGAYVLGHRAGEIVPEFTAERLARLREAALRWVLHDERITLAVVGVTRPEDIDQNIKTLSANLALRQEDRRVLAEFCSEAFRSPIIQRMEIV
jgi:aryl-alcohol dehydrogenase-like predicted oxidoreductase